MNAQNHNFRAALGQTAFVILALIFVGAVVPSEASARPARPYGGFAGACGTRLTELPKMCVEFKNAANEPVGFLLEWTENGRPMSSNLSGRSECRDGTAQFFYCAALQHWFSGPPAPGTGRGRTFVTRSEYLEGFRVTRLAYDSEYCFRFRAVDSSGAQSASWSGWTCARTPPPLEAPPAPQRPPQVTAMAATSGKGEIGPGTPFKVLVEWEPPPDDNVLIGWYSIETKQAQGWVGTAPARYRTGEKEGVVEFPSGSKEDESLLFRVCAENIAGRVCSPAARTPGRWWDKARVKSTGDEFNGPGKVVVTGSKENKSASETVPAYTNLPGDGEITNFPLNNALSELQKAEALRKAQAEKERQEGGGGNPGVKIGSKVDVTPTGEPTRPICELAREARARNSPAAPGLEAQCRAAGAAGEAPAAVDVNALAERGEALAVQDPLAVMLREQQPEGAARRGFDIGMAAVEGQTAPGPGKDRLRDSLGAAEKQGFIAAVAFSLERNRNAERAAKGAAIAAADPALAEARDSEADVFYRLGFDIATAIFGDPALGAQGHTQTGPGSLGIRDSLSAAGQRGFNAALKLHLSRNYQP